MFSRWIRGSLYTSGECTYPRRDSWNIDIIGGSGVDAISFVFIIMACRPIYGDIGSSVLYTNTLLPRFIMISYRGFGDVCEWVYI